MPLVMYTVLDSHFKIIHFNVCDLGHRKQGRDLMKVSFRHRDAGVIFFLSFFTCMARYIFLVDIRQNVQLD